MTEKTNEQVNFADKQKQPEMSSAATQPAQDEKQPVQTEQEFLDSASDRNELDEYLNMYVGEGKKYKNVKELAKAYANADVFIETLKREKQELAEEIKQEREKYKTLADILNNLQSIKEESTTDDTITDEKNKSLDINNIKQVVKKILEEETKERQVKELKLKTKQKLIEAFGSEQVAADKLYKFVQDNPAKKQVVELLSITDPDSLVKLIKDSEPTTKDTIKENVATPTSHSVKTNSDMHTGVLPITWSEARRIRKENPQLYRTHKFQQLLHRAALEAQKNGINFYNT